MTRASVVCVVGVVALWTATVWADDAVFEACRGKLVKAQQLEVLHNLTWDKGQPPQVTVGRIFFTLPIEAKENFADTVSCFLMEGDPGRCVNFPFRHWQTGKRVGEYSNCRVKMD